jgi:hypothetical protein
MRRNGMRAENGAAVEQMIKYEITSQSTEAIALVPMISRMFSSPGERGSEI